LLFEVKTIHLCQNIEFYLVTQTFKLSKIGYVAAFKVLFGLRSLPNQIPLTTAQVALPNSWPVAECQADRHVTSGYLPGTPDLRNIISLSIPL
jgi:hypothetical protein